MLQLLEQLVPFDAHRSRKQRCLGFFAHVASNRRLLKGLYYCTDAKRIVRKFIKPAPHPGSRSDKISRQFKITFGLSSTPPRITTTKNTWREKAQTTKLKTSLTSMKKLPNLRNASMKCHSLQRIWFQNLRASTRLLT